MIEKNIILDIKYIFLSLAQAAFKNYRPYNWDPDIQKTNIIIADKNLVNLEKGVSRPVIVLQRGDISWTYANPHQSGTNAVEFNNHQFPVGLDDPGKSRVFTDLLRGTVSFYCLHKNGIEAEKIANYLFMVLTAARAELSKVGYRNLTGLGISQEQIVKAASEVMYSAVQVQIAFTKQPFITLETAENNCKVIINDTLLGEFNDYTIEDNGTTIKLKEVYKKDTKITISFIDSITLDSVDVEHILTEDTNSITLSENKSILGYYKILNDIKITNIDEQI